jgi:predicted RNA-binding Zn ribbon-like protein
MSTTFDLHAVKAAGLTLVGEPIAVDLANTEKLALELPLDLLSDEHANQAFWELQAQRLSIPAQLPTLDRVRSIRSVIRSLLESRLAGRRPEPWAIQSINRYASAAPASPQLSIDWTADLEWHAHDGAAALLGAVARSAIDVLTGTNSDRLQRCAADDCSMIFVATNAKRQWCTSAGCGNRQRVARHAKRQRNGAVVATSP